MGPISHRSTMTRPQPMVSNGCRLYCFSAQLAVISVLLFSGIATSTASSAQGLPLRAPSNDSQLHMVCYYVATTYFPVQRVPANVCTHIINMAGAATPSGIILGPDTSPAVIGSLVSLKKQNPALKVMLSLTHGYPSVIDAGSVDVMRNFSKSAVEFLQKYNLDGIDMDWEFPRQYERKNFAAFIVTFSSYLKKAKKLFSAALPNNPYLFNDGFNPEVLGKYLDFMTVMTYDFHGYSAGDNTTGYNSPLFTPAGEGVFFSSAGMMTYDRMVGIPKSKLLMGLPLYGRSWTLAKAQQHTLHSPAVGHGPPAPYSGIKGVYIYPDVCVALQRGAHKVHDEKNVAAYLYHNTTWTAFDDPWTISGKIEYVKYQGFGGVGIWAMHLDDLPGVCQNGSLPLLNTIKSCL